MGSRLEANSNAVRKRIASHTFDNEEGEEYEPSKFGGFNDYFRRKKIKLQNLDVELRSQTNNPPIFRGVVAHVNGYTQPSLNDLHTLIVSYGGGFMQYLDGKTTVTHIIASNLTPKKKVEFARYRIVKPAWVIDSIEAGKLLPWDAYRVVDEGRGQRVLGFENGSITSQANQSQRGYRDQTDKSWYTNHVKASADQLNQSGTVLKSTTGLELPQSIERTLAEEVPAEPLNARDDDSRLPQSSRGGHLVNDLEYYVDADDIPAVNDSFTESASNTQEQAATNPLQLGSQEKGALISQLQPMGDQKASSSSKTEIDSNGYDKSDEPLILSGPFPDTSAPETAAPGAEVEGEEAFSATDFGMSTDMLDEAAGSEAAGASIQNAKKLEDMTPEEHNALILSDPKIRKSTVVNPAFLKQYYEESRLHHLSAWKASLKSQLQALAAEKSLSQKTREKRPVGARRYVLHVDFDSFFAAVSLKKFPQYVDKPVVIAHGNGAGAEIASSNYPARKFGIKNGMWMKHALKMCSDIKVLPYDFKAYEEASRHFYEAIIDTGGVVQSVSVDEALVDVSIQCNTAGGHDGRGVREGSIWREQAKADEIALDLRKKVKEKTGCEVSVGIGGNILLAKVALRRAKPAGQHQVKPEDALDFLADLKMQDLPGIAWSIGGKLEEIGVKFVRDVRSLTKERMISILGPKTGEKIWDYSRGIDRAEVGDQVIRKSVSAEVNWGIRFVTQDQAEEFVQSLCDELHKRLVNEGVKGRQLTMKIMRRAADAPLDPPKHLGHGKCDTFNKSVALGVATNDSQIIGREAISVLRGWGFSPGELRGIGCQMQKLEPIKGLPDTLHDSSQKRLQFKTFTPIKEPSIGEEVSAEEIETPKKSDQLPKSHFAATFAKASSSDGRPQAPLNTLGTQFVLPSQVDPATLAELPQEIRRRLFPGTDRAVDEQGSKLQSGPKSNDPGNVFPSASQIDQEALSALPEDLRAEVLAQHLKSPSKTANQALLPQSPRKDRTIKLPKKLLTPTKRRGRPLGGSNRSNFTAAGFSTLTQSNFVAASKTSTTAVDTTDSETNISEDFLSALPEDIRREVLAQARRDRLQKKGGIDYSASSLKRRQLQQQQQQLNNNAFPPGQRTLQLPPPSAKPTFTARRLSALPDLREAISAWYAEFQGEGPYEEDVQALVTYLEKVVSDEGDMAKAVSIVRWLRWVVDNGEGNDEGQTVDQDDAEAQESEEDQISWREAVSRVEEGVQDAVECRGLGRVDF